MARNVHLKDFAVDILRSWGFIKKHVEGGICLPTVVVNTLTTKVNFR